MSQYQVTITNGAGSAAMKAGEYEVAVTAAKGGYNLTSLTPDEYTATTNPGSQVFTLLAQGTLTLIFNETGAAGGTAVSSGSVVMTDSTGDTQYGAAINIGSDGNAVFNNVPYGDAGEPITLYFKQLSTDESHNVHSGVINVSMTSQTATEYVVNTPVAQQTFSLNDATYTGLPVGSATMTFTEENE